VERLRNVRPGTGRTVEVVFLDMARQGEQQVVAEQFAEPLEATRPTAGRAHDRLPVRSGLLPGMRCAILDTGCCHRGQMT
jgi:hypothetical protein